MSVIQSSWRYSASGPPSATAAPDTARSGPSNREGREVRSRRARPIRAAQRWEHQHLSWLARTRCFIQVGHLPTLTPLRPRTHRRAARFPHPTSRTTRGRPSPIDPQPSSMSPFRQNATERGARRRSRGARGPTFRRFAGGGSDLAAPLNEEKRGELSEALADHERGLTTTNPTIRCCWHAHRLEAGRKRARTLASG
jgi:hypothetical protein